jgi:hypothetical protein
MPDYYGKIGEVRGKLEILGLGRVWPEKQMQEELWLGTRWIDSDVLSGVYGPEADADWGPLSEELVKELADPGVLEGGLMAEK